MTVRRVRIGPLKVRKKVHKGREQRVRTLLAVTSRLKEQGILTPQCGYDAERGELVFPTIDGVVVRDALAAQRMRDKTNWKAFETKALASILEPILALHSLAPSGLQLEPYDPWRRVRTRLHRLPAGSLAHDVYDKLAPLVAEAGAFCKPGVVHGDLHVGQLILARDGRSTWVIDLDDAALGPREADFGNFIAHLCTSPQLYRGEINEGVNDLIDKVMEMCASAPPSRMAIERYCAASLLRRALKLGEKFNADRRPEPFVLQAASSLCMSAPLEDAFPLPVMSNAR